MGRLCPLFLFHGMATRQAAWPAQMGTYVLTLWHDPESCRPVQNVFWPSEMRSLETLEMPARAERDQVSGKHPQQVAVTYGIVPAQVLAHDVRRRTEIDGVVMLPAALSVHGGCRDGQSRQIIGGQPCPDLLHHEPGLVGMEREGAKGMFQLPETRLDPPAPAIDLSDPVRREFILRQVCHDAFPCAVIQTEPDDSEGESVDVPGSRGDVVEGCAGSDIVDGAGEASDDPLGHGADQGIGHPVVRRAVCRKAQGKQESLRAHILAAEEEELARLGDMRHVVVRAVPPVSDEDSPGPGRGTVAVHHCAEGAELILLAGGLDNAVCVVPRAEVIHRIQVDAIGAVRGKELVGLRLDLGIRGRGQSQESLPESFRVQFVSLLAEGLDGDCVRWCPAIVDQFIAQRAGDFGLFVKRFFNFFDRFYAI